MKIIVVSCDVAQCQEILSIALAINADRAILVEATVKLHQGHRRHQQGPRGSDLKAQPC